MNSRFTCPTSGCNWQSSRRHWLTATTVFVFIVAISFAVDCGFDDGRIHVGIRQAERNTTAEGGRRQLCKTEGEETSTRSPGLIAAGGDGDPRTAIGDAIPQAVSEIERLNRMGVSFKGIYPGVTDQPCVDIECDESGRSLVWHEKGTLLSRWWKVMLGLQGRKRPRDG